MDLSLTRRSVAMLLGATALTVPALAKAKAPLGTADVRFADMSARWLDAFMRLQPVGATQTGDHRFDGEVDDMSAVGRGARLKAWQGLLAELTSLDRSKLSRDNQVDAAILASQLRHDIWDETVMQSWAWDPQQYSGLAGNALYSLMAREFAPLPVRMHAAVSRIEKLPALYTQMRANLVPARVPLIHAQTVAKQNGGVIEVLDSMVMPHAGELSAADQARLTTGAAKLKAAVTDQQTWLDTVLVPNAKGDFRIGAKLFDEKLVFTLNSTLSRKDVRERAEAAIVATRATVYELSLKALEQAGKPAVMGNVITPDIQQAAIEAALALGYAARPARDKVVEAAETALAKATDFVKAKDLITLPDSPVAVVLMPEFARGVAVAYCDSPGPLDKGMRTYFDVSPIPDDWTQEQADSFLREYNSYGIQDIAVHEAMPGHYVQLWHANACPSVLRAVLSSGSFVEGWAVYAEAMMADQGFLGGDPLYKLAQLKVLLRTISNSILDQAIHVDGISKEDAMVLMTKTAFQQEREASGKWVRASLSSTQLSTYFVGVSEHNAMRAEAQKRAGAAFSLKAYHDRVLAYGSAPARYVRALMFDEPIEG
ncbi:MAG TPA: DUF885 domain-containing protein [Rhizomicrobium sp.]|nr:DUF885 domain-containing protein [Rhizomicrobium sp.]